MYADRVPTNARPFRSGDSQKRRSDVWGRYERNDEKGCWSSDLRHAKPFDEVFHPKDQTDVPNGDWGLQNG